MIIANPFLDPAPEEPKFERFVIQDVEFSVDLKTDTTPTYFQVWALGGQVGGYLRGDIADAVLAQRNQMREYDFVSRIKMCLQPSRSDITKEIVAAFGLEDLQRQQLREAMSNTIESAVADRLDAQDMSALLQGGFPVPAEKLAKPLPVRFTRPGKQGKVSKHRIKPVKTNPLLAKLLGKVVQKD